MSIRMPSSRSWVARVAAGLSGVALAAGLLVSGAGAASAAEAPEPAPTPAAASEPSLDAYLVDGSVASFRADDIISDKNMYDPNAMTAAQVQSFLVATVPSCATTNCIDIRSFPASPAQPANNDCSAVAGGLTTASAMIAAAGKACGVSQKALLALIQKESSLIGSNSPTDSQYDQATGYACPDGSSCDPAYRGFFLQVYNAARQLDDYRAEPRLPIGTPTQIDYSPNPDCGSSAVTIRTVATAALYSYTPYQPNDAAKVQGSNGNACSSIGNLLFWFVYTDWFGYPQIDVDRIQGADRYEVAVNVAEKAYPDGAGTVFIATGTGYADALSAGPAAVQANAPLLLTPTGALTSGVADEISKQLKPQKIVIVGGPNSVSPFVQSQLAGLVPGVDVERIGGADRFEVSRNLAAYAFPSASGAYVATGLNFPDALSASGAGGHLGRPVVLVNGGASSIDGSTAALLESLKVTDVRIAGGPNSVSDGIQSSLDALPGVTSVERLSGADRFAASLAINQDAYGTSDRVFLATGLNFPDALAGSAYAGALGSPLLVVPQNCLPRDVRLSFKTFDNTKVTLLGGPNSLGAGVAALTGC
ncbi:cell wall-binding repeat-containing protein [Herbiconiux liangxiaofengii]|uniref:cell wall-binding repeat-containing protein n=1 Tax=Herbiconiux liangxiaofengii TaxID=3342795 RepID=UPI0035B7D8DA